MLGYPPPRADTPLEQIPRSRHPPEQTHPPPGADTPTPQSRHPHPQSRHSPRSRHPLEQTPPGADIPRSRHPPPPSRHSPEQTPPRSRHPSPEQTPPPGSRLQHTVNERPVRILLECILVWSCYDNDVILLRYGLRFSSESE